MVILRLVLEPRAVLCKRSNIACGSVALMRAKTWERTSIFYGGVIQLAKSRALRRWICLVRLINVFLDSNFDIT